MELQRTSSRIWTRDTNSIFYDVNRLAKRDPFAVVIAWTSLFLNKTTCCGLGEAIMIKVTLLLLLMMMMMITMLIMMMLIILLTNANWFDLHKRKEKIMLLSRGKSWLNKQESGGKCIEKSKPKADNEAAITGTCFLCTDHIFWLDSDRLSNGQWNR